MIFLFTIAVVDELVPFTIILSVGFVVNRVCMTADGDEALISIDKFMACLLIVVAASLAELKNVLDDFAIVGDVVPFCRECEVDVWLTLVVDSMKLLVTMMTGTTGDDLVTFGAVDMVVFMVVFMVGLTTKDGFVVFDIVEVTAFPVTVEFIVIFLFTIAVVDEMVPFTIILSVGFVVNRVCMTADGDEALINIDEFMACLLIVVAASLAELKNILDDFAIVGDVVPFCRECEVDVWLTLVVDSIELLVTMVTGTTGDDLVTFGAVDMVVFVVVFMVGLTTKDGFVVFDIVEVTAFPVRRVVFFVEVVAGEMVLFNILLPVGFVVNTVCMTADGDEALINIDEFVVSVLVVVAASLAELSKGREVDVWLTLVVDNIKNPLVEEWREFDNVYVLVVMVTGIVGEELVAFVTVFVFMETLTVFFSFAVFGIVDVLISRVEFVVTF